MTTEPTQPLTEGTGKTDTPGVLAVETVAIGPECFATKTGDVLCWRGRNYVPQDLHSADVRKFSGIVDELDAEVSRLRAENTDLAERLAAAAALHVPTTVNGIVICQRCLKSESALYGKTFEEWPCEDVRALGVGDSGEDE